jgi:NADPH oxidase 1
LVLTVDTMVILLPMCRTLLREIRPKVRFLPLDESIWFHRQVAYAMLVFVIAHTAAHYVK